MTYRNLNFALVDAVSEILGVLTIDSAADGEGGSENFLDGTLELFGEGLVAHDAGDLDDLFQRNVSGVLDY